MKKNSATSTQKEEFQQLLQAHAAAWSKAIEEPEAPARFFAPDEDVICFDLIPPFAGYRSWQQFKKSVPNTIYKAVFTMHDGLQVRCRGDIAWTIGGFHISLKLKNGKEIEGDARQTAIWEKREGKWLMVHLHESTPVSEGCTPYRADSSELQQLKSHLTDNASS